MKNQKQTSQSVASLASGVLSSSNSSAISRQLAASALSQANTSKQTGARMETVASNVLTSSKYSETSKILAASVLAQANKAR